MLMRLSKTRASSLRKLAWHLVGEHRSMAASSPYLSLRIWTHEILWVIILKTFA